MKARMFKDGRENGRKKEQREQRRRKKRTDKSKRNDRSGRRRHIGGKVTKGRRRLTEKNKTRRKTKTKTKTNQSRPVGEGISSEAIKKEKKEERKT